MLLVTRREGRQLVRYAHLSTGNYNTRTAKLYTDLSHLTADPGLTADVEHVFVHLASQSRLPRLNSVWLAPFHLQRKLVDRIDAVGDAAAAGRDARIVLKMNALTDQLLILALVRAGRRGARIDLIVRGACMLPARVPGLDRQHPRALHHRALPGAFARLLLPRRRGRAALPVQRRLDEPQHAAAR